LEELKAEAVDETLKRYKSNWLRHATRMNTKQLGRPLKRLLDEAETGLSRPNS
jgi:hypothetical protein